MDTKDSIDRLLLIAGGIMEDISVIAIVGNEHSQRYRAAQIAWAGFAIATIGLAATAMINLGLPTDPLESRRY